MRWFDVNQRIFYLHVMDQVISRMEAYDYNKYIAADVQRALNHDSCTIEDFAALLSPVASPFLKQMAFCLCLQYSSEILKEEL
jgi:hypothetical protein